MNYYHDNSYYRGPAASASSNLNFINDCYNYNGSTIQQNWQAPSPSPSRKPQAAHTHYNYNNSNRGSGRSIGSQMCRNDSFNKKPVNQKAQMSNPSSYISVKAPKDPDLSKAQNDIGANSACFIPKTQIFQVTLNANNFNKWCFLRKFFHKRDDELVEHLFEIHGKFCQGCSEKGKTSMSIGNSTNFSFAPDKNTGKISLNITNYNNWTRLRKFFHKKDDDFIQHVFLVHEKFCHECNQKISDKKASKPPNVKRGKTDNVVLESQGEEEIEQDSTMDEELQMQKLMGFSGFKSNRLDTTGIDAIMVESVKSRKISVKETVNATKFNDGQGHNPCTSASSERNAYSCSTHDFSEQQIPNHSFYQTDHHIDTVLDFTNDDVSNLCQNRDFGSQSTDNVFTNCDLRHENLTKVKNDPSKEANKSHALVANSNARQVSFNTTNFNKWSYLRKFFHKRDDELIEHLFEIHEKFCQGCNEKISEKKASKAMKRKRLDDDGTIENRGVEAEEEVKEHSTMNEQLLMEKFMGFSGFKSNKLGTPDMSMMDKRPQKKATLDGATSNHLV